MRTFNIFLACFLAVLIICPAYAQDNSVTLVTYYPAPHGSYKILELYPGATLTTCSAGEMYYDSTKGFQFCISADTWASPDFNSWQKNGTYVSLQTSTDYVGIGTAIPTEKLQVSGNFKLSGAIDAGGNIASAGNISGASLSSSGVITANGDITSAEDISANGTVSGSTITASGNISTTGGNITSAGSISAVSNIATSSGDISANGFLWDASSNTLTINGNINVTGTGTITTSGNVTVTGTVSANSFVLPVKSDSSAGVGEIWITN